MKRGTLFLALLAVAMVIMATTMSAQTPQTPAPQATPGAPGAGQRGPQGLKPPAPAEPVPAVMPAPVTPIVSGTAPTPDPRVGLKAGRWDAAQAAWNMKIISATPPTEASLGSTHSDLAFNGKYAIQGNYNGFEI